MFRLCIRKLNPTYGVRDHRTEGPGLDISNLFCRSASVLGRPRPTEPSSPNTRTLFCRSASVLGRPRPTEPLDQRHKSSSAGAFCGVKFQSVVALIDGGGRGRTRSGRRAFVYPSQGFPFDGPKCRLGFSLFVQSLRQWHLEVHWPTGSTKIDKLHLLNMQRAAKGRQRDGGVSRTTDRGDPSERISDYYPRYDDRLDYRTGFGTFVALHLSF